MRPPSVMHRRLRGMTKALGYLRKAERAHLSWDKMEVDTPEANGIFQAVRKLAADDDEALFGFCAALHNCVMGWADGTEMDSHSLAADVRAYWEVASARSDPSFQAFLRRAEAG